MTRDESSSVSVIITCFNGERWIADAIDSALAQSCAPREIIVVDDASTDGSCDILRRYEDHPAVELLLLPRNAGIPAAKNAGVARCNGRFVAMLEQDDVWFDNKLARQVEVMEADPSCAMVFCDAVIIGPDGNDYVRRDPVEIPDTGEALIESFFMRNPVISMSSVMFRRSALVELGGFDEQYVGGDDYALFLRLAGRFGLAFIDEPLLRYRWHRASFSWRRADRMIEDHARIVDQAVEWYPYLAPLAARRTAQLWLSAGLRAYENGEIVRGFRCALKALSSDPWSGKSIAALGLMATGGLGRGFLRRRRWGAQFRRR